MFDSATTNASIWSLWLSWQMLIVEPMSYMGPLKKLKAKFTVKNYFWTREGPRYEEKEVYWNHQKHLFEVIHNTFWIAYFPPAGPTRHCLLRVYVVISIFQYETNTFCNLRQIHFTIWNKRILQFETNTYFPPAFPSIHCLFRVYVVIFPFSEIKVQESR